MPKRLLLDRQRALKAECTSRGSWTASIVHVFFALVLTAAIFQRPEESNLFFLVIIFQHGLGHSGSRGAQVLFLGDTNMLFTTGFSRMNDREIALWDVVRNMRTVSRI